MRNLKIMISYKGTRYHGFQIQPNALTVQEVLERAISSVLNHRVSVIGCSRTDTGVHANSFCLTVQTDRDIPCRNFVRGVNGRLPSDISILSCEDAPLNFHPRYDALIKEYVYKIHNSESKDPFTAELEYHYRRAADIDRMRCAAEYFKGTHDFKSFCSTGTNKASSIRTVYSFDIEKNGDKIIMTVRGNGFLYNMVRIMVGTLLFVNEKRFEPDDIPRILQAKDRKFAGKTAMAHGLYLNRVIYEDEKE